jgi:thiol-disulfide isomerase/thioredoxin
MSEQPIDPSAQVPGHGATSPPFPPPPEPRSSRTMAWVGMAAVAVTLVLLWVIPALHDHSEDQAAFEAGAGIGESDASAVGKPARLDFTMKDMNGVDVKLASFKGKIILLNFWATWCGPCKVEIPDLVALQDAYRDKLVILGVLVQDEMNETIAPFAAEYKINYPLLDGNGREDMETAYGPFWGIPSSVIIGPDGNIAMKHAGILPKEEFERELEALLPKVGGTDTE